MTGSKQRSEKRGQAGLAKNGRHRLVHAQAYTNQYIRLQHCEVNYMQHIHLHSDVSMVTNVHEFITECYM